MEGAGAAHRIHRVSLSARPGLTPTGHTYPSSASSAYLPRSQEPKPLHPRDLHRAKLRLSSGLEPQLKQLVLPLATALLRASLVAPTPVAWKAT